MGEVFFESPRAVSCHCRTGTDAFSEGEEIRKSKVGTGIELKRGDST